MDIVFLLYESRSGSTLLSRLIAEKLKNVFVTPEIGFEYLIKKAYKEKTLTSSQAIEHLFNSKNYLRNLNVNKERIVKVLETKNEWDVKTIITVVMAELAKNGKRGQNKEFNCIVVKNGSHTTLWKEIFSAFCHNVKFIYIFRDPRAVINSQLKTMRPYFPEEPFAWGGSLFAAYRWRSYSNAMNKAKENGVDVLDVCYESFVNDPDGELKRVGDFLGVAVRENPLDNAYFVPKAEEGIHAQVFSEKIKLNRSEIWKNEMSKYDISVIESFLAEEMSCRGYNPTKELPFWLRTVVLLSALPKTVLLILLHLLRMIRNYFSR